MKRMMIFLAALLLGLAPLQASFAWGDQDSPFDSNIGSSSQKTIIVDPVNRVWGAFDTSGDLIKWGKISAGKDYCPDLNARCKTPSGTFTIYRAGGADCVSSKFPLGKGGAPMPYCMYFKGGFALHGAYSMPDFNASHGCVRMYPRDAQWLAQNFVDVGRTKVIIKPY